VRVDARGRREGHDDEPRLRWPHARRCPLFAPTFAYNQDISGDFDVVDLGTVYEMAGCQ
jgi:hypothetical protein